MITISIEGEGYILQRILVVLTKKLKNKTENLSGLKSINWGVDVPLCNTGLFGD